MTHRRMVVLAGVFALLPGVASAQDGWWEWLEKLSGPGPYQGVGVGVRVFCILDDYSVVSCLSDRRDEIRHLVTVRAAFLSSGDNTRFSDAPTDTETVRIFRLEPVYLWRAHPALDLGVGLGFMRFSGVGFDSLYRFTLTPLSITFTPGAVPTSVAGRRAARLVRLRYDVTFVTQGYTGADFGNTTTTFSSGAETLSSFKIVFDVGSLIWR